MKNIIPLQMSFCLYDGKELYYNVELDAISPKDIKVIILKKSFDLLNLENYD